MQGIAQQAEQLLASEEGLCPMQLLNLPTHKVKKKTELYKALNMNPSMNRVVQDVLFSSSSPN
jgi:hypothetical protein